MGILHSEEEEKGTELYLLACFVLFNIILLPVGLHLCLFSDPIMDLRSILYPQKYIIYIHIAH